MIYDAVSTRYIIVTLALRLVSPPECLSENINCSAGCIKYVVVNQRWTFRGGPRSELIGRIITASGGQ